MSKWYKFYICEFINNKYEVPPGFVLVKFGITHHMDVMDRFNPEVDDGYSKNYSDWTIKIKYSEVHQTKKSAEKQEKFWLLEIFPYNSKYKVWVEDLFQLDNKNFYYDNTGITELRLLPINTAKQIYQRLNRRKQQNVHQSYKLQVYEQEV